MRRSLRMALLCGLLLLPSLPAAAQSDSNLALNAPDQVAWQLFIQVNTSAGGTNATFETWASDSDTFKPNPQFPTGPVVMALARPRGPGDRAAGDPARTADCCQPCRPIR